MKKETEPYSRGPGPKDRRARRRVARTPSEGQGRATALMIRQG